MNKIFEAQITKDREEGEEEETLINKVEKKLLNILSLDRQNIRDDDDVHNSVLAHL